MKQYVNYYGEETEKVPLPVAYHLEKGCGRINDTTRDGTICIAMDIKMPAANILASLLAFLKW